MTPNTLIFAICMYICNICQRYEGAYFGVDRCDGLPTMDEQMMQPINNDDDNEQANVVFIYDLIYRQLMTYPITCDRSPMTS
jgi:hypothetical protein